MTSNLIRSVALSQWLNKTPVFSSQQMGWNGILVEQCQGSTSGFEKELPALEDHWLNLHMGQPVPLTQRRDDRLHQSIIRKGDVIFVPSGQPNYTCLREGDICKPLHICIKPELITHAAETLDLNGDRINLVNCFSRSDPHLLQIAMLLLDELRSGGIMGQLYAESLTQVLVIHLLRHYSTLTQTIPSDDRSLTQIQLQQAIDYVHAHLNRDLSLAELASVVNISPTYFASLFKQAIGISPHQYVIQQRVEQAKLMLSKTDLAIADIALQVGFSSQSHLTQQFKRITGMTPKQIR
jgi:AraC family transcriptional regulator